MRVWVTRDEPPGGPLSQALRRVGHEPIVEPVIRREKITDAADEIARLTRDDWLVLTSTFAIECVAKESAHVPKIAVVGQSSAKFAGTYNMRVELISTTGDAAGLFAALRETVSTGTVCYPRSSLVNGIDEWQNINTVNLILYETVQTAFDKNTIDEIDVVAVTSPSAVKAIGHQDLPFASLGPSTSAALREIGVDSIRQAQEPNFRSLAAAVTAISE